MARTTMANLILELRGLTQAGTADYAVAGVSYWTDDHLQAVLDRHRLDVYQEELQMVQKWIGGGSVQYFEYFSQYGNYEATSGGTAVFYLEDSTGADLGTANYTPDYTRGVMTFGSNTAGTVYYLTGRSYDLYGAAADVWRQKASQVTLSSYSWSTDNMRIDKTNVTTAYLNMANYYASMSTATSTLQVNRGDASDDATY